MKNLQKSMRRARRFYHTQRVIKKRFNIKRKNLWVSGYNQFIYDSEYKKKYGIELHCFWSFGQMTFLHPRGSYFEARLSEFYKNYTSGYILPKEKLYVKNPSNILSKKQNKKNHYRGYSPFNKKFCKKRDELKSNLSFREQLKDLNE